MLHQTAITVGKRRKRTIILATTMHPDKPVAQRAERPVYHLDRRASARGKFDML